MNDLFLGFSHFSFYHRPEVPLRANDSGSFHTVVPTVQMQPPWGRYCNKSVVSINPLDPGSTDGTGTKKDIFIV